MREEDVRALTVINIAFGLIRDGEVVWDAKDARDGMVSIRKSNPELKIVLSVGESGYDTCLGSGNVTCSTGDKVEYVLIPFGLD